MAKLKEMIRGFGLAQWLTAVAAQTARLETQFINCSSYEADISSIVGFFDKRYESEAAAETRSEAVRTNIPYTNHTRTGSASSRVTPLPFEEYYCVYEAASGPANAPHAFPNNGTPVSDFDGLIGSDKEQCLVLQKANYSSWVATASYPPYTDIYKQASGAWNPIRSPPCCNTFCDLTISRIQLLYWPTPAPTPHITTLVSDGFTFSSPSAYLIYHNISMYGVDGPACNSQWPVEVALTKAYDPSDISSYPGGNAVLSPTRVNYADLWNNCTSTDPAYYPSFQCADSSCPSALFSTALSTLMVEIDHCFPVLSVPGGLDRVHSEWATCYSGFIGPYQLGINDPPHALIAGNALAGPTPVHKNPPIATSAAPIFIASQSQPAQTSAPDTHSETSKPPVDPITPNLDLLTPDPAKTTSGNTGSINDLTGAKAADPGGSAASKIPFILPAQIGSQNQPAISPRPGQVPQVPGDWNSASNDQLQHQQEQQAPADQPVSNAQIPGPASAPVFQTTEVRGHHVQTVPSSSAIVVDSHTINYGGPTVQVAGSPVALHLNGDLIIGSSTISAFYTSLQTPASFPQVITATRQVGSILSSNAGLTITGTTLASKLISFEAGSLIIGSSMLPIPTGGVMFNVGGISAILLPNDNIAFKGTTIAINSISGILDNIPISLGSNGIIGSSTISGISIVLQNGDFIVGSSITSYQSLQLTESTSIGLGAFINSAINNGMGLNTMTTATGNTISAISGSDLLSSTAVSDNSLSASIIVSDSTLPSPTGSGGYMPTSPTAAGEKSFTLKKEILGAAIAAMIVMMLM